MHRPEYNNDAIVAAIRIAHDPNVYDDVACWDNNGCVITTGCFVGLSDSGKYKVLCYYDEPQIFAWDNAVTIPEI